MPQDIFGLSGKYYGSQRPLHDPEDHIMPEDLCDSVSTSADNLSQNPPNDQLFYLYPNRNLFSLGEWYWNQGVQKSKQAFLQLIKIVGELLWKSSKDAEEIRIHSELYTSATFLSEH